MAAVDMVIKVDTSSVLDSLKRLQRQNSRQEIAPIVAAWCPDLNHYAKNCFVEELLDALF